MINSTGKKNESLIGLFVTPVGNVVAPCINELLTKTEVLDVCVPVSVLVTVALSVTVVVP